MIVGQSKLYVHAHPSLVDDDLQHVGDCSLMILRVMYDRKLLTFETHLRFLVSSVSRKLFIVLEASRVHGAKMSC